MGLLTDGELIYVAGFASSRGLCDAVMEDIVDVSRMRNLAERINKAFGGFDGVVDFCDIYTEFGKDKAKVFLDDFTIDKKGTEVYGFDSPEERESWLADPVAHWENY